MVKSVSINASMHCVCFVVVMVVGGGIFKTIIIVKVRLGCVEDEVQLNWQVGSVARLTEHQTKIVFRHYKH